MLLSRIPRADPRSRFNGNDTSRSVRSPTDLSIIYEIKACKLISRDIYIDLSASFRFVYFSFFASLLLHIHTHATNYLKNLLSHPLPFARPSSLATFVRSFVRSLSYFFFWIFSLVFSYKTKWHLFGIGRKNTLFNVYLFLIIRRRSISDHNPPPSSFSLINPSVDQISDFFSSLYMDLRNDSSNLAYRFIK